MSKAKFLQTSISVNRVPAKPIIDRRLPHVFLGMSDDRLAIEIDYIGYGDTSKLTNEEILAKVQKLLGEELF